MQGDETRARGAAADRLDRPVQFVKGVGPRRAEALARLGVRSIRDLLLHVPRRYEDASTVSRIASIESGMDVTAIGEVVSSGVIPTRSRLRIFQAVIRDATGLLECAWPGQPFLERTIRRGDLLLVSGPVRFFHGRQMQPREHVVLGRAGEERPPASSGLVLPVYPATEGMTQRVLRAAVENAMERHLPDVEEEEPFTPEQLERAGLPRLVEALRMVHHPSTLEEAESGRRRLAFEELFFLQLLHARSHHRAAHDRPGIPFQRRSGAVERLYRALPFELTEAQARAVREIFADMAAPTRMNRLLQGDVGSGKTVVALFAMLLAVENGFQAALMAPTEILAEQHARTLGRLLGEVGPPVTLLTGGMASGERREAIDGIGSGEAAIVVGTHALFQEGVAFQRLGLAVIDEQHRFGVRQRLALAARGPQPDVLVMSATPIPRSLALTLHGDLDITVLDQLPAGRLPVRTAVRDPSARERVYGFVAEEVARGRQAFIIYPLVEESEKVDMRAATEEYRRLSEEVFPGLRVGLVHGQLRGEEKDAAMRRFADGDIDVLVSTTVVEVGVDVPNATVMVVEHAERFGLSQLHQLRGRVGRGPDPGYCVLIAEPGADAADRLGVLARTGDGFEIARADLRLRGMGEFFGERQHGLPEFRFFHPERDERLLLTAREMARGVVEGDPELARPEHSRFREVLETRYGERERLSEVG